MRSFIVSTSALIAANVAVANIIPVITAADHGIKTVYEAPRPTALARRQDEEDVKTITDVKGLEKAACSALVEAALLLPPIPDQELFENLQSLDAGSDECAVTVPASLSSQMNSWISEQSEWFETIDDKAAKTTDCGIDDFLITLPADGLCTESLTVYYTENSDKTITSSYEPFPTIKDNVLHVGSDSGVAPRSIGMVGAGIALAGVISMVLAF